MIARFIPVVRTFLNPVAGTLEMPARTFLLWNTVGGLVWTEVMLLIGYLLAATAPVVLGVVRDATGELSPERHEHALFTLNFGFGRVVAAADVRDAWASGGIDVP